MLKELLYLVIRDEARHVTFGVNYLEEFVATLSDEEREARAEFAYQACIVSRDRLIGNDVFRYFGWDVEDARHALVERGLNADFLNMLYARIIPNLKRIGLLTERIRPKFEAMGVLELREPCHRWRHRLARVGAAFGVRHRLTRVRRIGASRPG